jgi:nucleotide sugar dehydrogenase
MSPERVDPGRELPLYESIPKIISGLDDISLKSITQIYSPVFDTLVPVSHPEIAEMTKLYENCQRMMCFTLANEMADACHELGLSHHEVSRAAATKPFGFLPVTAGPGVGGHCVPVNPWYLLSTSKSWSSLEVATRKMRARPAMLADRLLQQMSNIRHPRILVVGFAFKPGESVTSNSPGVDYAVALVKRLSARGRLFDVQYYDPLVAEGSAHGDGRFIKRWTDWRKTHLEECFDAVVVLMKQREINWSVLDTCDKGKVQVVYEC